MVILRATDNFGNKADLDILNEGGLFCDVSAIESGDIGSVYGVSSQEFILPGTDNNNAFFGNLFDIGANPSVALNHTIYASVLIDGQEGFDGRLYINDLVTDSKGYTVYKAVIVNEFVDFKQRIRNLKMQDLDFSDLDHNLTFNNVTSSWDGNLADGNVVYPLVDYGTSATNIAVGAAGDVTFNNQSHGLKVTDLKPGLKVKRIIDAIFDQVNYNYSSSFIEGDYFDKIFTLSTPNENRGIPGANPTTRRARANFKPSLTQSIADGATTKVVFPNEEFDNDNNYDPATGTYTVSADDDYEFATYLDIEWDSATGNDNVRRCIVELRVNGTQVAQKYLFAGQNNADTFGGLVHFEANMSIGDTVEVFVTNETLAGGISGPVTTGVSMDIKGASSDAQNKSVFDATSFATQAEAGVVRMNQIFPPEMSVEEFLKGIIQKFNLVIEPKQNERNVLIVEPFNTWIDGGATLDWSSKVDHSVRKSIRGTMVDREFIVNFKDAEDEDFLNQYNINNYGKVFGEKLYTSNSDLTQGTKVIGEFFAPTPIASIDGSDSDYIPMLYQNDNGVKVPFTFKPRLLHFNGKKRVFDIVGYDSSGNANPNTFYMRNDAGNGVEIKQYGSFHYLDLDENDPSNILPLESLETKDLNWDNLSQRHYNSPIYPQGFYTKRDAIFEYWSFFLNELYDPESKKLTLNIRFNPEEITDLQLNSKIFIDGHYYRIDKISSFPLTEEGSVQVELIKAPLRKMRFPRRRIYNIEGPNTGNTGSGATDTPGGGFTDVVADESSISSDGGIDYVLFDDLLPPTGSGNQEVVRRASTLDGFNYYANDSGSAVWKVLPPATTAAFRPQQSAGENNIDYSANNVNVLGNNNTIQDRTNIVSIQGGDNTAESFAEYVNVQGDNNTVQEFTKKSSIISSTNSQLKNKVEFGTIIGGEDTIISGSNKSVAIGQDLIIQGGNSNIAIGNFDTQTKEVKDLINVTAININKSIDSADDYENGLAYMGSTHHLGAKFADNQIITVSDGDTIYLTGSEYAHDYYTHFIWSGGNGTANVYLPDTNPANFTGGKARDSRGYKRELRFFGDENLASNTRIRLYGSGSDTVDDTTSPSFVELKKAFDAVTLYAYESGSWIVTQAKA